MACSFVEKTMSDYILINRDTSVVELADKPKDGAFKRFRKQIMRYSEWVDPRDPKKKMKLDRAFAEKLKSNFDMHKYGSVAVPLGHPDTPASLVALNKGEVIDIEVSEDGVFATMEIRKPDAIEGIEDRTIPDVSMGFDENYLDKETGTHIGPLLKHVGLVVDPYLKGMNGFVPLGESMPAILFSDSQNNLEKEQTTMQKVKNDRAFDIEVSYTENGEAKKATVAAGAEIEVPQDQVDAVTKQIADAQDPAGNGGQLSEDDQKAKELADREAAIAAKEADIKKKEAELKFSDLLEKHKVIPAQKDAFMALSAAATTEVHLSDTETKTVETLLAEFIDASPVIELTDEKGKGGAKGGEGEEEEEVELSDAEKTLAKGLGIDEKDLKETKKEEEK